MAKLAIDGHATRGKEVIEILKMLGGDNSFYNLKGTDDEYYFINSEGYVDEDPEVYDGEFIFFTLEQFLEKFPYKVGDKVRVAEFESEVRIDSMKWDGNEIQYEVFTDETEWYSAEELNNYNQPQTMSIPETMKQITDIAEKLIKIDIPKGYEFVGIDDNQQVVFEKIGCQYPKTYKECCKVLGLDTMANDVDGYKHELLIRFQELLIARDVYWKIAGEQMGLEKPWESNPNNIEQHRYAIYNYEGTIATNDFWQTGVNAILAFPTEEMRDAFYENFKELIKACKELL